MYIIGVAGGSGAGKSTFTERIKDAFPDEVTVLSSDNYYRPHDDITMEARNELNYDTPEAIEFSLMVEQVAQLKKGNNVQCPIYDFSQHTRSSRAIMIETRPIIILDGILLFTNEELRKLIDLKVYIETDADERILRRTRRDVVERGRTIDSVILQYLKTVKPMHYLHVEPSKAYADIIVNGGINENAIDLIKNKITNVILVCRKEKLRNVL